jgi:hypothetical protein
MDGQSIYWDADRDTSMSCSVDDTIDFTTGGTTRLILTDSALTYQVQLLSGGADQVLTGDDSIRLDGRSLYLDDDNDASIASAVDDTIVMSTGGSPRVTVANTSTTFTGLLCSDSAGTCTGSLATGADDIYAKGNIEADASIHVATGGTIGGTLNMAAAAHIQWNSYGALRTSVDDGMVFFVYPTAAGGNHNIIISSNNNVVDHDHAIASENPTVYLHSKEDANSDNSLTPALFHNGWRDGGLNNDGGSFCITTVTDDDQGQCENTSGNTAGDIQLNSEQTIEFDINSTNIMTIDGTDITAGSGNAFAGDHKSSSGNAGITDNSSYWFCTAANCASTCQVTIEDGLIVGCP